MNNYQKGNFSEAVITAKLLELGYAVFIPVGGGHRYDLIIETSEGFKKVQVKTGRLEKGCVIFNTCSNNKGYNRKNYRGEIDLFAVYCQKLNECYLIPIEKAGVSAMSLRVDLPKSNQKKKIHLKNDYLLKTQSTA